MITIELGSDDFDRNGLVILWKAADAVLKATGNVKTAIRPPKPWHPPLLLDTLERWPVLAHREVWNKIDAGVVRGILKPVDAETHAYRSRGDCADGVVPLAELVEWGNATGLYEFKRVAAPAAGDVSEGVGGTACESDEPPDMPAPWSSTAARPAGVTAEEIKTAFPFEWHDKLQKCTSGRYQWLAETWVRKGSQRPGDATKFNPVSIAVALVTNKHFSKEKCADAIAHHFLAWQTEWEEKAEYL